MFIIIIIIIVITIIIIIISIINTGHCKGVKLHESRVDKKLCV
jgi:hypothetical protein